MPFIIDKKVDDTIMFEPQQQQVNHMVPMARTSMGKKSVLIHGIADRVAVEEDEPDDEDQHHNSGRGDAVALQFQSVGIDGDERERDCYGEQAGAHSPDCGYQDAAAADWVDGHHVHPGHDEVGAGDDEADGGRVGEAD